MQKVFYILFTLSIFHQFVNSQWIQQNGGTTVTLFDIEFVNENTGWITGTASKILKTTNGGINWTTQIPPIPLTRDLNSIQMFDANTGYIGGWTNTFLKTTNGGENWLQLPGPSPSYGSLNAINFIDVNTGWACAFLGIIWKTTNGGLNWDSLYTGSGGPLRDIQFINSQTGWVVGDVGYMRKTTNGGTNWFFQFFGTTADYWRNSLHFINNNTGFVVGYDNTVFKTTDAGNLWDTVSQTSGICLHFANALTGWSAGNDGDMYKTTNGGQNFYQQSIPVTGGFFTDIEFVNDTLGWSVDVYVIMKTTNGGGTFVGIDPTNNTLPSGFILKQNYPNPFNPSTDIKFELPKDNFVTIRIYNAIGEEVAVLVNNEWKVTGSYSVKFDGSNLTSGIYFYSIVAGTFRDTKKMVLIK